MASIRIPFPEKDEPGVVLLQGPCVTVGRLPFNTLQIIDRTVSGFHAEFIQDNGHYRLHDRGSTNGTFVNGEPVTDFHLREACKISFGTIECEFDPAAETAGTGEAVPTREEIKSVRQENATLRSTLEAVREEVKTLRESKPGEQSGSGVAREEFTKVVAEREVLREGQTRLEQEVARLKAEVAVLRRDRENLQRAWDATKLELAKGQAREETVAWVDAPVAGTALAVEISVPPLEEVLPAPPAGQAAPLAAPANPIPFSRPGVVPFTRSPAPVVPAPVARPPVPAVKPAIPVAAPTVRSFPPPRPATPPARLLPVTAAPAQTSSGVRPFPRAVQPSAPAVPVAVPKPTAVVMHPRTSVMPSHPPLAGAKGTQKIG